MASGTKAGGKSTRPDVFIIESLDFEDEERRREGEIISRALRLAGKDPIYHYVRTRRELEHFVAEFERSGYRYLHLSCHGDEDGIATTFDPIDAAEFGRLMGTSLSRRRLFLSTCLAATEKLARGVFAASDCYSVAGPVGEIAFHDSVVLWTTFYHLMFKENATAMKHKRMEVNLSKAGLILDQQIRLFKPATAGGVHESVLPPPSKFVREEDV